jgi:hypothetical protein
MVIVGHAYVHRPSRPNTRREALLAVPPSVIDITSGVPPLTTLDEAANCGLLARFGAGLGVGVAVAVGGITTGVDVAVGGGEVKVGNGVAVGGIGVAVGGTGVAVCDGTGDVVG